MLGKSASSARVGRPLVDGYLEHKTGLMGLPLTARFPVGKPVVPAALTRPFETYQGL